ncbi:class I SAM-dependent DNA methyltransferase [Erythrobacter aurantius]|uniref:class I SAM-dependent DNA methyltransferase n=1 Tax=Erythrobacter aurantius TaxID=2909249 RepID=UPI00207A4322|nr:DNA methyltransferase [Erythrobacter aurantius]
MTVNDFIAKWAGVTGGAERANLGQFINDMCQALGLPLPGVAEGGVLSDYQFEGPVQGGGAGGNTGAIDLYKKGCFVLEGKQSKLSEADKAQAQLFDIAETAPVAPSGARYDKLMRDALAQAKRYAVNLPADHPWPPFLIVCDVGRAFELYFDFTGNGRGYAYFPDQQSYRIELHQFADPEVQATIRAIWTDPASIDPRAKSAEVSREIARRLAQVSKWLEQIQRHRTTEATDSERSLAIEETALFLMRVIFCMFAEDVGLLPKESFTKFLERAVENEAAFEPELQDLWTVMGSDGGRRYASAIGTEVRYFNGGLFASAKTYKLSNADRGELFEAAKKDWTKVEPAIFGTLLEQALTPSERAKLGAHYTPRPYVERLVQATIMEVLEAEWEAVQNPESGDVSLEAVQAFHDRLCALRILDPACGTGNFLYVAMENLMRLEGDVVELIRQLGGTVEPRVGPQQFLGLELNPRAAVIAELVLWIGWLRWRMKNDPAAAPTPVLKQFGNINFGGHAGYDAVLRRTHTGEPDTENPTIPDWPEADFIIGNPPFIAGQDLRKELGGDYAEALWQANQRVPKSADFVMQWWDRAAHILAANDSPLIRFGFVTTNSITQTFSRRVIESYLQEGAISLLFAIPDHPWIEAPKGHPRQKGKRKKEQGPAAVRIAMTVAMAGETEGALSAVRRESDLDTDSPKVDFHAPVMGKINADLTCGTDVTKAARLQANFGIGHDGVKLHGKGFSITRADAITLKLGQRDGLDAHIRPYRNGKDLAGRNPQAVTDKFVIDLLGLEEREVRQRFPEVYEHLLETVKPERDKNRRATYRLNWWVHGEPRREMRPALEDLDRYIGTVDTAKHRLFQFLPIEFICDDGVVIICSDNAFHLGVLSSDVHSAWAKFNCSALGLTERYPKSLTFDPFPFPDATPAQRAAIADLAEELDETRKLALAEVPRLTMTEIYNLRERQRTGQLADLLEVDRAKAARVGIIDRLHEQIDAEVAAAYGWPADLPPAEIVARLVALNAERASEEKAGKVRWLRPDYQVPRFGSK